MQVDALKKYIGVVAVSFGLVAFSAACTTRSAKPVKVEKTPPKDDPSGDQGLGGDAKGGGSGDPFADGGSSDDPKKAEEGGDKKEDQGGGGGGGQGSSQNAIQLKMSDGSVKTVYWNATEDKDETGKFSIN